jgi:DNA-3-methyladenine glycosylase II
MPSDITRRDASTATTEHEILGPWSLATSRRFWEGFTPSALAAVEQDAEGLEDELRATFLGDEDWMPVAMRVTQDGASARITVTGRGDLDAASAQVLRLLSLDVDGRAWPTVAERDPVIADAQARLPGFRPCGFYSPYEAAAWSVLSQRIQMRQAARIKADLTTRWGVDGAFPSPEVLRTVEMNLPGRKLEYLHAVADAAADGLLAGRVLRSLTPSEAMHQVCGITGLGPFAAELVVIRGAMFPDVLPQNEARLSAEIADRYGSADSESPVSVAEITDAWRPFRSWASVHLRALQDDRSRGRSAGTGSEAPHPIGTGVTPNCASPAAPPSSAVNTHTPRS